MAAIRWANRFGQQWIGKLALRRRDLRRRQGLRDRRRRGGVIHHIVAGTTRQQIRPTAATRTFKDLAVVSRPRTTALALNYFKAAFTLSMSATH